MSNNPFLTKISDFIAAKQLLSKEQKYIVTLSGGADSVTLLFVLKQLGYDIEAAHCNFKLRGSESDRDEGFCRKLCERENIHLHVVHFDTRAYAALHKVSIEMAARNLRYSYFEQLRKDIGAGGICVAHHSDDSVETLLLNLMRGTGIHGLKGIAAINGNIIRPLLCVSRHEIEEFLTDIQQDYVTDSTNLVNDVKRNKIRLDIIPMLKKINPSVCENIQKTALRVSEAIAILDDSIAKSISETTRKEEGRMLIDLRKLKTLPSPEYVLHSILKEIGYNSSQVEQVYATACIASPVSGRIFYSQTHRLLIDRDCIIIEKRDDKKDKCMVVPETGTYIINEDLKIKVEAFGSLSGFTIDTSRCCACVDMAKISFPLKVRRTATGDRFIPFGMRGSKLISKYLTDRKMTLFDKDRQLVVEDASGRIVWLVGERLDNRFRIDNSTTSVVRMQCIRTKD